MIRETIYQTLFEMVSTAANFKTVARRLRHQGDVPSEEMPALFQLQKGEEIKQRRGLPPINLLSVELWVYAHSSDDNAGIQDSIPSSVLNPLLDAIDTALAPMTLSSDSQMVQTLGLSNVSHCWIDGHVQTFEGILGNTILAIVPVNILAS